MTTLTVNASDLAGAGVPDRLELWVTGPSVRDVDGNTLRLGGTRKFPSETGKLSIELLATDTPDTDPLPNTWGYTFELRWSGGGLPAFDAPLPGDPAIVDLASIQPMDPANPVYRGPQGDPGPKGDTGDPGPKGDVGPAGMQWRGNWNIAIDYVQNDAVAYGGSSYFAATNPTLGDEPGVAASWQPFAIHGSQGNPGAKGDTGDKGDKGDTGNTGATPNVQIGTVSTGPAAATMGGTTANPLLNLVIPTGNVLQGSGSPEGVVTASPGAVYSDTAKTLGVALWRKDTGTGNTGWKVVDGDTGERNISTLLNAPAVPLGVGTQRLRRIGNMIYAYLEVSWPTAWTSGNPLFTLPAGFRPSIPAVPMYMPTSYSGAFPLIIGNSAQGAVNIFTATTTAGVRWQFSFPTLDAWPTALPGTALP